MTTTKRIISIIMFPTIDLGSWQVSTYQVTAMLALITGGVWSWRRLQVFARHYPRSVILLGVLLAILGGLWGVLLITPLINMMRIRRFGFLAHHEGLSIVWGLAVGFVVVAIYCRWHGASLGRALDMAAPPLALGLALGRVGCFAVGCCFGRVTDSHLGMHLPDEHGLWANRYPTQLMAMAANLGILLILLAVERYGIRRAGKERTWPFNGFLILLFFLLYSSKRFILAFCREAGAYPLIGPLSWMHLNALIVGGTATVLIIWNLRRQTTMGGKS